MQLLSKTPVITTLLAESTGMSQVPDNSLQATLGSSNPGLGPTLSP